MRYDIFLSLPTRNPALRQTPFLQTKGGADTPFDRRLAEIYRDMCELLDTFKPDCVSIEKLYFNTNITTGIDVAQARGVITLSAALREIPIYEYTPLQVKVAVTGYDVIVIQHPIANYRVAGVYPKYPHQV